MGCDIHFFVEARHPETGAWEHVGFKEFYTEKLAKEMGSEEAAKTVAALQAQGDRYGNGVSSRLQWRGWYNGRNYRLFGVLAGVRDREVPRIDAPRGMPEDASAHVRYYPHGIAAHDDPKERAKALSEYYGVDEADLADEGIDPTKPGDDLCNGDEGADWHSRTWFTVAELLAFDWDQASNDGGLVSAADYMAWRDAGKKGNPDSWCKGVNSLVLSNEDMDAWLAERPGIKAVKGQGWGHQLQMPDGTKVAGLGGGLPYTRISWAQPLRKDCDDFLDGCLQDMKHLAELRGLGLDSVRAVFYFDN